MNWQVILLLVVAVYLIVMYRRGAFTSQKCTTLDCEAGRLEEPRESYWEWRQVRNNFKYF
jgi:hypothetical protein